MAGQKVVDFRPLFRQYKGKWVALDEKETKVVGFGNTIQEALTKAKASGTLFPVILKASLDSSAYFL